MSAEEKDLATMLFRKETELEVMLLRRNREAGIICFAHPMTGVQHTIPAQHNDFRPTFKVFKNGGVAIEIRSWSNHGKLTTHLRSFFFPADWDRELKNLKI